MSLSPRRTRQLAETVFQNREKALALLQRLEKDPDVVWLRDAFIVCDTIGKENLYITRETNYGNDINVRVLEYDGGGKGKPCQAGCNRLLFKGQTAWWMQGLGVWHLECPMPWEAIDHLTEIGFTLPLPGLIMPEDWKP